MPQNMAGHVHVLTKELVGASSAAKTTQKPDIVGDSSQISEINLDGNGGL